MYIYLLYILLAAISEVCYLDKLIVNGGRRLDGRIRVHGAKNSVLPILAATILCEDECVIRDCPDLSDVKSAFKIIECLGGSVKYDKEERTAYIDTRNICRFEIPDHLMREMRSSVMFLGAIIARMRRADISYPGGCELGARPIDLHLKAFRQMGVKITELHGHIRCGVDDIKPQRINLLLPSVGATENIMLLSATADGTTVISNAAREPEIADLQRFLNALGADVSGAGTEEIVIRGVKKLRAAQHRIIPDRIAAATYMCAAAACGGDVLLENVCAEHIGIVISMLEDAGCEIDVRGDTLRIKRGEHLFSIDRIKTLPYPGFPTDIQAPFMAAMCMAAGTTMFIETIFENRFKHAGERLRMGADIKIDGRVAVVHGNGGLLGAPVTAADLRGGAALTVAALAARGQSEICGVSHIDRGYESIESAFSRLGGDIIRASE